MDDEGRLDKAAQWLYDRIMKEREAFYETEGYTPPLWKELGSVMKGLWREEAQHMLKAAGVR